MLLAAYELLKGAIKEYFQHHDNYTIQANDQKDQQGLYGVGFTLFLVENLTALSIVVG
jgi:hypothetical protein